VKNQATPNKIAPKFLWNPRILPDPSAKSRHAT